MFSSFFHFGLYPTPLISYIAVPRFVVISTIPLAPRTPYNAVAVASFRIEKEAISSTSTRSILRSTPSTSTKGLLPAPKVLIPRIQKSAPAPGSPERCMTTIPANCPAKPELNLATGIFSSFIETVLMAPITLAFRCLPYATTVTSSSSAVWGCILTTIFVCLPTKIVCVSIPRKETTSLSVGKTSITNVPSKSVITPLERPSTNIDALGIGSPNSSNTFPVTFLPEGLSFTSLISSFCKECARALLAFMFTSDNKQNVVTVQILIEKMFFRKSDIIH